MTDPWTAKAWEILPGEYLSGGLNREQMAAKQADIATALRQAYEEGRHSLMEHRTGPCSYCGEPVDNLASNPSKWPLYFPDPDQLGTGKGRDHHVACVVKRLAELPDAPR